MALFDSYGNFVEFVETFSVTMESGYFYNLKFENDGLSVYPGSYYWGVYYKPNDGNWIAVADGEYENFVVAEVYSPFGDSDIKLYDSIKVTPNPLVIGQAVRIDTKIANYGNADYSGRLGAGLFYPNGDVAQELEVFDATLTSGYFSNVWYENNSIDVEPGKATQ